MDFGSVVALLLLVGIPIAMLGVVVGRMVWWKREHTHRIFGWYLLSSALLGSTSVVLAGTIGFDFYDEGAAGGCFVFLLFVWALVSMVMMFLVPKHHCVVPVFWWLGGFPSIFLMSFSTKGPDPEPISWLLAAIGSILWVLCGWSIIQVARESEGKSLVRGFFLVALIALVLQLSVLFSPVLQPPEYLVVTVSYAFAPPKDPLWVTELHFLDSSNQVIKLSQVYENLTLVPPSDCIKVRVQSNSSKLEIRSFEGNDNGYNGAVRLLLELFDREATGGKSADLSDFFSTKKPPEIDLLPPATSPSHSWDDQLAMFGKYAEEHQAIHYDPAFDTLVLSFNEKTMPPQAFKLTSLFPNRVVIIVDTTYVYKEPDGFQQFTLEKEGLHWKIRKIAPVSQRIWDRF